MKRIFWVIGILLVIGVIAFFVIRNLQQAQANASSAFETVALSRGDLTASVGATGTVRANQSTVLSWQLSGTVQDVQAAVGDLVQINQPLAILSEASLPQSVILARADLITARRSLEQLQTSQVAGAQAQQTLVLAQKELEDALKKRESKNYDRALPATVDVARANLVIAEDAVKQAESLYDRVDDRPEDDPVRAEAFSQLAAARRSRDTALANLNWLLGRPDDTEVAEADARVALAQANLAEAQREWERLKNGPDPEDVAAAEARVKAIEASLAQIDLEAPFTGTVTEVNQKPGDQIQPGSPAFRLDDLSRLLVDVQIAEVDINNIRVGQPAMLTFDAAPEKEYGGRVVEVARVGTNAQTGVNFTVVIELENADESVRPGMTAAVTIITDLVEGVLLVPNRAVRLNDGERVVWVLRNNTPQMVPITLGLTSDVQSEVIGGDVQEGDQLILNPPTIPSFGGGGPFGP